MRGRTGASDSLKIDLAALRDPLLISRVCEEALSVQLVPAVSAPPFGLPRLSARHRTSWWSSGDSNRDALDDAFVNLSQFERRGYTNGDRPERGGELTSSDRLGTAGVRPTVASTDAVCYDRLTRNPYRSTSRSTSLSIATPNPTPPRSTIASHASRRARPRRSAPRTAVER